MLACIPILDTGLTSRLLAAWDEAVKNGWKAEKNISISEKAVCDRVVAALHNWIASHNQKSLDALKECFMDSLYGTT
jgi:hypothetical protein